MTRKSRVGAGVHAGKQTLAEGICMAAINP